MILLCLLLAGIGVGGWMAWSPETEDWSDIAYDQDHELAVVTDEVGDPIASPDGVSSRSAERAGARQKLELVSDVAGVKMPNARQVDAALGFQVRAIRKDSREPIAGASILYFDTLAENYRAFRSQRRAYEADKEVALRRAGERVLTNAEGIAFVPHGIPSQSIVVRFEDLYAELAVSQKKDPPVGGYVAELELDRTMRVRVVDETGRPVTGIPLAYYVGKQSGNQPRRWRLWRDPDRDTKSKDGVQRLPHVQRFVSVLRNLGGAEPIVHIGLDLPGLTRCGPTISMDDIPPETLDVVMGPVGRVVVKVTDQDGEPVQRRIRLSTKPDFVYPDLVGVPRKLEAFRPKWTVPTDADGIAVFEHVGIGTELRVESVGEGVGDSERAFLMGPGSAGDEVRVALVKPFTAAILEGVAADEAGRPLAETVLQYEAPTSRGTPGTAYLAGGKITTDAAGRFVLRLPPTEREVDAKGAATETNLYSMLRLNTAGKESLQAGTEVKLPKRLRAARHSVGTVRLALPTLIASGRVFLDDKPMKFFNRFVIDFRNPDNKNRWERVKDVAVHSRAGGFFELRGELRDRKLRLRPRSYHTLPIAPLMVTAGQHGIEIRFRSAGTIRTAVLFDAETADANMEVMLRPIAIEAASEDPLLKWSFIGRVDKRGSGNLKFRRLYWWSGLPPGRYRVELRLLGQHEPFAVVDQIEPTFGRRLDQVRPDILNLRGAIRRVRIRAQDTKGRAIRGLVIPIGQTALQTREGVPMTAAGAVLHTTRRDGVDVLVMAKGYRTEKVYGVSNERVVRMRPGIPITVGLAALRVPREVKITVQLRRRAYDTKRLYRSALRHPINGRSGARPLTVLMGERDVKLRYRGKRQWKATVMEHGQFRLRIRLTRKGQKPVYLRGYSPCTLMVRDTPTEHRFHVKVSPTRLAQALRSLGVQPVARKKKRPPAKKK